MGVIVCDAYLYETFAFYVAFLVFCQVKMDIIVYQDKEKITSASMKKQIVLKVTE